MVLDPLQEVLDRFAYSTSVDDGQRSDYKKDSDHDKPWPPVLPIAALSTALFPLRLLKIRRLNQTILRSGRNPSLSVQALGAHGRIVAITAAIIVLQSIGRA